MTANIKRTIKIATIIISAILVVFIVGLIIFISLSPRDNDIKTDRALAIAKYKFGCEKVLWISTSALALSQDPGSEPEIYTLRSHYAFYVVGEKAGEEVYIVIPSTPKLDDPYITTWSFDYAFSQIVEKFNEHGANYVAEVPDDYYGEKRNYIDIETKDDAIGRLANYYAVGDEGDTFYERLDVKAVFTYGWEADGYRHYCIVTQEGGELRAYERVDELSGN